MRNAAPTLVRHWMGMSVEILIHPRHPNPKGCRVVATGFVARFLEIFRLLDENVFRNRKTNLLAMTLSPLDWLSICNHPSQSPTFRVSQCGIFYNGHPLQKKEKKN